jgi:hypothetical protein
MQIAMMLLGLLNLGTELVELEFGVTYNESTTIALSKAIEQAVLEIINIGYNREFWK